MFASTRDSRVWKILEMPLKRKPDPLLAIVRYSLKSKSMSPFDQR